MPEYIFRGDHAVEIVTGEDTSVMLGPGETIDLTAKQLEANESYKDQLLPTATKGGDDK